MSINKQILVATVCVAGLASTVQAQVGGGVTGGAEKGAAFQYFFNNSEPGMAAMRVEAFGKTVTGKPLSAVEVRRTRQTLGDGTHIDKIEKDKYYRDFDGRTRIDRENGGNVMISDQASGTARGETGNSRSRVMVRSGNFATALPTIAPLPEKMIGTQSAAEITMHKQMLEKATAEAVTTVHAGDFSTASPNVAFTRILPAPAVPAEKGVVEELGDQVINGVMARGTRTTITIPLGQIGNDREIKVVSERWFSEDLGLLIKSSNNDPRFGETTFELTEILQGAPDPTLFDMSNGANFKHN